MEINNNWDIWKVLRSNFNLYISFVFLIAVDGTDIRNASHEQAVKTIKSAGDKMKLLVQSLNTSVIKFVYELFWYEKLFFIHF